MRHLFLSMLAGLALSCGPLGAEEETPGVLDWTWQQNAAEENLSGYPAWIWRHAAPELAMQNRYFTTTLELPQNAEITTGWLRITADNAYILYVNGHEIGRDEWWQNIEYWDIKPFLTPGTNRIAVTAWIYGGAAGLYAFGEVKLADGEVVTIRTDATWQSTLQPAADWTTSGLGADSAPASIVQEGVVPENDLIDWHVSTPERFVSYLQPTLHEAERMILPIPQQLAWSGKRHTLPFGLQIAAQVPEAEFAAEQLAGVLQALDSRFELQDPAAGSLTFALAPEERALPPQGYALQVGDDGTQWQILARTPTGFLYGVWSFLQLVYRDGDEYRVPGVTITDFPDVELRGIVDAQLVPDVLDWMSFYKINAAKLYMNYTVAPRPELLAMRLYAEARGIHLVPSLHPPTLFSFQPGSQDMQMLLQRVADIRDLGFREICILQDDYPNETAGKDCETYGPGIEGLVHAQSYMVKEIVRLFKDDFDRIIFMPRVYFDPTVLGPGPKTEGAPGHLYYREKLGDPNLFPSEVEMYTTRANPDYTAYLHNLIGHKSHVFQNYNEAALAGFLVHYEPYPVVERRMLDDICGLWLNGADTPMPFRYWQVNYLTFAENTWNLAQPIGLRPAFAKEYGTQAVPALAQYAELLGGHADLFGTMEEYWYLPETFATRVLMSDVNCANPTPDDLARFAQKAQRCREAAQVIAGVALPESQKAELLDHAVRMGNTYELKIAFEAIRERIAAMDGAAPKERKALAQEVDQLIAEAMPKARQSQRIIRKMGLFYTTIIPDYSFAARLQQLHREMEVALNKLESVPNGSFEKFSAEADGTISALSAWQLRPVADGKILVGTLPAAAGRNALGMRSNERGEVASAGQIVSDAFQPSGKKLQWRQAAQNGNAVTLQVQLCDAASGRELASGVFYPRSGQWEMASLELDTVPKQPIQIKFAATTREPGLGWLTWLDDVTMQ